MSAQRGGGTDQQAQSKTAAVVWFWVSLLIVELVVVLALVAIFVCVTQVENQIATWPPRHVVSCDDGSTAATQPGGPLLGISRLQSHRGFRRERGSTGE